MEREISDLSIGGVSALSHPIFCAGGLRVESASTALQSYSEYIVAVSLSASSLSLEGARRAHSIVTVFQDVVVCCIIWSP